MVSRLRRRLRNGLELPATYAGGMRRGDSGRRLPKGPPPKPGLPASLVPHTLEASCPSCLPHIDKEAEDGQAIGAPGGSTEIPVEFLVEVN